MHLLTRGGCPTCLNRYQHGRDNWETLHEHPADVREVRTALDAMHGSQCAYCETATGDDWHIEHLWARSAHPQRTFLWGNLFASCQRKESCGTYKDRGGRPYQAADLIDPSTEDPDAFLFFTADGRVQPRAALAGSALHRALETIRVFNLNAPVLVLYREQVVAMLLADEPDVIEFMNGLLPGDRRAWVIDFVNSYCSEGWQTPVRHLLTA